MRLTCNGKTAYGSDNLTLCPDNIGCSMSGNDDLYDLGFSHEDLRMSDLILEVGEVKIVVECQVTKQNRLLKQFQEEFKVSDIAAKHFLFKAGWNYGQASLSIRMQRANRGERKPCGEIPLTGSMQPCNLGSDVVPDLLAESIPKSTDPGALNRINEVVRSCFPVLPSTPLMAKDEPSFNEFMPKTVAFQEQDRLKKWRGLGEPGMMTAPDFCKCSYPTYDHVSQTSGTCGECGKLVCQAGMEVSIPVGYYRLTKESVIQAGDQYLSTTGKFEDVTPFIGLKVMDNGVIFIRKLECRCQNGMVGTEHCPIHGENPCLVVEDRGLNMECVCNEVGKIHCRLHSPLIEHGGSD